MTITYPISNATITWTDPQGRQFTAPIGGYARYVCDVEHAVDWSGESVTFKGPSHYLFEAKTLAQPTILYDPTATYEHEPPTVEQLRAAVVEVARKLYEAERQRW